VADLREIGTDAARKRDLLETWDVVRERIEAGDLDGFYVIGVSRKPPPNAEGPDVFNTWTTYSGVRKIEVVGLAACGLDAALGGR
jgi:hypothetical protein